MTRGCRELAGDLVGALSGPCWGTCQGLAGALPGPCRGLCASKIKLNGIILGGFDPEIMFLMSICVRSITFDRF